MELIDNWLVSIGNKIIALSRVNVPLKVQLELYEGILTAELKRVEALKDMAPSITK